MNKTWLGKPILVFVAILTLGLLTTMASAQPLGVDNVTVGESSRFNDTTAPTAVDAQAGNVTELLLNSIAVTKSWQGFYGNVTGTLILADASDNRFYDWNVSVPKGQVYASRNNTLTWVGAGCAGAGHITSEEAYLGQNALDPDSVSSTFTATNHPAFDLAGVEKTLCPTTQAYNASGEQGSAFWQVLMADAANNVIYTTIIEDTSPSGFNAKPWHFQLLVGENGKIGFEGSTPYYFYLELI